MMALPNNTIRKLLREQFPGDMPIMLDIGEIDEWETKIKDLIDGLRDVEVSKLRTFFAKDKDVRDICQLTIYDPGKRGYYDSTYFYIHRDASGYLTIEGGNENEPAYISDLEELTDLIAICQERLDRREAQQNRRDRMRNLKIQAIIAQVKKIAKAEKFDFYFNNDDNKLNLYVCLSESESVELQIPFKQYQELIPNIAEAVQHIRRLKALGMKFKMTYNRGWRSYSSRTENMVHYKDL
ncbi:MAG: hypothetical protein AAF639_02830 [Chloroflexota bacterium]